MRPAGSRQTMNVTFGICTKREGQKQTSQRSFVVSALYKHVITSTRTGATNGSWKGPVPLCHHCLQGHCNKRQRTTMAQGQRL